MRNEPDNGPLDVKVTAALQAAYRETLASYSSFAAYASADDPTYRDELNDVQLRKFLKDPVRWGVQHKVKIPPDTVFVGSFVPCTASFAAQVTGVPGTRVCLVHITGPGLFPSPPAYGGIAGSGLTFNLLETSPGTLSDRMFVHQPLEDPSDTDGLCSREKIVDMAVDLLYEPRRYFDHLASLPREYMVTPSRNVGPPSTVTTSPLRAQVSISASTPSTPLPLGFVLDMGYGSTMACGVLEARNGDTSANLADPQAKLPAVACLYMVKMW